MSFHPAKVVPVPVVKVVPGIFSDEQHVRFKVHECEFWATVHPEYVEQGILFLDLIEEQADFIIVRVPGKSEDPTLISIKKETGYQWYYQIRRSRH